MLIFRLENGESPFSNKVKRGQDWNLTVKIEHMGFGFHTKGFRTGAWRPAGHGSRRLARWERRRRPP